MEAGEVISLVNTETRERILYPRDHAYDVDVEEETASLFHAIEVPADDADFDTALRKVGQCRLTVSNPVLKARLVSALETKI